MTRMRIVRNCLPVAAVVAALFGFSRALEAAVISIDVPGASGSQAVAINEGGVVAGNWFDAQNIEHGFVRAAGGKLDAFSVPASNYTIVSGIDAKGAVTGYYQEAAVPNRTFGFLRTPAGKITKLDTGNYNTAPMAISPKGWITGVAYTMLVGNIGFVRAPDGKFTAQFLATPGVGNVQAHAVNDAATVAGSAGAAFVRTKDGTITLFYPGGSPNAGYAADAVSINDGGTVTGTFLDSAGIAHGFVRSARGKIATFDPAGSTGTYPTVVNANGWIAGYFTIAGGGSNGFYRDPAGRLYPFTLTATDTQTFVFGANAAGEMVGSNTDANGVRHGFITVPQ